MSDLKIYVFDMGWEGAEMYITDSMQKAKEFFRDQHLPEMAERSKNHYLGANKDSHNPWVKYVDEYRNMTFPVDEYEIKEGQHFYTEGGG